MSRTPQTSRRSPVRTLILLALCGAGFTGCDASTVEPELDSELQAFVTLVNDHRAAIGCPRLNWNDEVAEVARAHSQDMVDRDFFAHTNPDGDSPADRLRDAGIDYRRMAENIAHGYGTGAAVLEGWLGSSGHRAAIENCQLLEHGVAVVGSHWTHLFVTLWGAPVHATTDPPAAGAAHRKRSLRLLGNRSIFERVASVRPR